MSTPTTLLDVLADRDAAGLELLKSENPRLGRSVARFIGWLCDLEPEEMQHLLGQELADSWHEEVF